MGEPEDLILDGAYVARDSPATMAPLLTASARQECCVWPTSVCASS